ncbi:MAG: ABC transporter permease [Eubacterium sp.]|nr:ABC transporter permease [Eubacterium sp.]
MKEKKHRRLLRGETAEKLVMTLPVSLIMYLLVAIPFIYIIIISFMHKGTYGGVTPGFTFGNYLGILNPLYLKTFGKSLLMSAIVTMICLLIAYPFSWAVAGKGKIARKVIMSMVMVPFCMSMVIRLFSWIILLRSDGVLNRFLMSLHLIDTPFKLVYNSVGAYIGLVYMLLPFMIMPLYSSMEKLDRSLLEAASDLGSNPVQAFLEVTLPLTKPGIFAGSIMVFIPSLGLYFITDMMGGSKALVIGNLVKNQFITARNWPLGAAMSVVLMLITLLMVRIYTKTGGSLNDLNGL